MRRRLAELDRRDIARLALTFGVVLGLLIVAGLTASARSQPSTEETQQPWPQVCRVVHPEDLDRFTS